MAAKFAFCLRGIRVILSRIVGSSFTWSLVWLVNGTNHVNLCNDAFLFSLQYLNQARLANP